jgi:putative transposase
VARRKKGSHRRNKAVKRRAKQHQQVKRQRADVHHQAALLLVRAYDTISLEDVRVAHLVRTRRLSTSMTDAGWAPFRGILEGTAADADKRVVAVPPASTSQDGSGCRMRIQKTLSVRTHLCTACGLVIDRDENAAINIVRAGQARRGAVAVAAASKREALPIRDRDHVTIRAPTREDMGYSPLHNDWRAAFGGALWRPHGTLRPPIWQ